MKILLLDINYDCYEPGLFLRHSRFEPLGIEYLASMAIKNKYNIRVLYPSTKREIRKAVRAYNPDVIGFSVMTYNFSVAKSIAKEIKKLKPKIITIFGGYHPSSCPDIVKDKNIDFVVIGEAENTFIELINAISSKENLSKIKGVSYFDNGDITLTEPRERIQKLDLLPFPLRDNKILKKCRIYGLSYPPPSEQRAVCQVIYSRGCSFNCKFCNSYQVWGNQVVWRSPINVLDEIDFVQKKFGTNTIFFADLTFNLNKNKILKLCREIIDRGIKISWYAMCRPDDIDEEILSKMKHAGCTKISYGIDSLSNNTISEIKPSQSINIDRIKSVLELTDSYGIIVKAYLMIGYPWDDKNSIKYTECMLKKMTIDELRISFVTPFPATILFNEFIKKDIITNNNFDRYTTDEPIIKPKDLSQKELINAREKIFKNFYFSKEYEKRKNRKLKRFPYLKQSYCEFFNFLGIHN